MKNISLALILSLLCSSFLFSQSNQSAGDAFMDYQKLITNQQFEESLDYIYPKLFTLMSKEQMLKVLKATVNNPLLEVEFGEFKLLKAGAPQKIENQYYSLIDYSVVIKMKVKTKNEKQRETMNNRMLLGLQKQFGEENVSLNRVTGYFEVKSEKKAVAISKDGKSKWTFLTVEPNQKLMMEKILPSSVVEELF